MEHAQQSKKKQQQAIQCKEREEKQDLTRVP